MPYTRHPGEALSPAEAAHLLIREAQGEALPAVPVREGQLYRLAQRAALSPDQLAAHRQQLAQVAACLFTHLAVPLSA